MALTQLDCDVPGPLVSDGISVVIDGIVFSLQRHGGISVYFHQLTTRLLRDEVPSYLTLEGPALQSLPETGLTLCKVQRTARLAERYRPARVPPGGSLFHSSYYRLPDNPALPSVVTVHDFTYERCLRGPRRWLHSAQKFAAIRAAQAIICVSEATRDDLIDIVGVSSTQQVYVIRNGVDANFKPQAQETPARPFVLFVGQRGGYKNFHLVARAMTLLPDFELLCVGGGALGSHELHGLPRSTRDRIRHLGFVTDPALNQLYNQAVCLAYPSSYEGFGIPVVEAMKAGCPVVCIRCKAVIEVGMNALSIVAPDASALAERIDALASSDIRDPLIRTGLEVAGNYDWERTYRETLRVYRAVSGP